METKSPLKSKTVWMNLVMALAAFYPPAQEFMASKPELMLAIFSGLNIALRLITKDKISLS